MKIDNKWTQTQNIELSEKDIERILRMHMVEQFGPDWNDANYNIWSQAVKPYMGQIDDEYEIVAHFKLVKED